MTALPARRLTDREREALLRRQPMWQLKHEREAITRYLRFDSFAEAFGFMSAVAIIADRLDHHPEWSNVYDRVEIILTTHDADGLSPRDAALAERIDDLALLFGADSLSPRSVYTSPAAQP
ncbi:pterin-4-alpha-carbinolamine dehydratase [Sphingomonas sp. Leaf24]|uniref:4a-hydroxytetrahydrobiopterin dehydratase n=1 Tax=unclassified Sphingomonas TaxID=196159 RepID=UPI0006FE5911|nr:MULTISPECIES: 4a-hydroxytetrahydrobiopterin dehydratase [unclassified Sphingomonas]KQM17215.1 pterin-4-alpha-carbinolamine dehydratase [Sphingomonas sp. Leaf5]KQM88107.1 pterin-4-alpha-carbinolamine dehydratase [Sphingomonas sp. Leaf24]